MMYLDCNLPKVYFIRTPEYKIAYRDIDRFWAKVDKTGECWNWLGGVNNEGYGLFHVDQRLMLVHRFSYILNNRHIPDGADVCHTCENTRCVNPTHLETGTRSDNMYHFHRKRS